MATLTSNDVCSPTALKRLIASLFFFIAFATEVMSSPLVFQTSLVRP
jgi:hypothetical protein